MSDGFRPVITIFHCINAFSDGVFPAVGEGEFEVRSIKLPCSSMVKDVYLLRAYEAGADAVIVLACPEGECKYVDGNIRAGKRVKRLKALLDEIGLGAQRLNLFNIAPNDMEAVAEAIQETVSQLKDLGPNPAARNEAQLANGVRQ